MSKARPYTSKFFTLSYYNPNTGKYAAGHDDLFFMTFCIVLFSGLRAGVMDYILAPLARMWGLSKKNVSIEKKYRLDTKAQLKKEIT